MATSNFTLDTWRKLSSYPLGKWLFSRLVCIKAPYFASIRPRFVQLEPGHSEVRMKKRRSVKNHIGTVHAIAMCNLAEIAAGTMTDATVPKATHRWIPRGMTVEYLLKAETDLRAVATLEFPASFGDPVELPVKVDVTDTAGNVVFRASIGMWITPKRRG